MKLYNVTYNLEDMSTMLIPKIPHSAGDGEDKIIRRVCLSDSLEHCLQAFGSAYRDLANGVCILIREVEVDEDDMYLINPSTLKEYGKVPDALENNEYWYLKPIICNVKMAEIIDADTEFTIAWTCVPIEKCKEIVSMYSNIDGSKYKDSEELYNVFMDWANENKKWNEMDEVYEKLLEIPWTQKTAIENLKVKYLQTKITPERV